MSKKFDRRRFLFIASGFALSSYLVYRHFSSQSKFEHTSAKDLLHLGFSIGCAYAISGFEVLRKIQKGVYKDAGFGMLLVGRFYISKKDFMLARKILKT